MRLNEAIAKRLEDIFKEKNKTAHAVGKLGGIPKQTIYALLRSQYKKVTIDTIYQIIATLGITLKDFFDDPIFNDISD